MNNKIKHYKTLREIYNHFIDYFGIERVDVKPIKFDCINTYERCLEANMLSYIYIHYPEFEITNNNGNSHTIKDLFIRVNICVDNTITGFSIKRTTFTNEEIVSNYCHSHCNGIYKDFHSTCLGTGPIVNTIRTLTLEYDEDILQLFIRELDLYIKHESLEGIPYKKITEITEKNNSIVRYDSVCTRDSIPNIDNFCIKIIKENKLPISCNMGVFTIGMSITEFHIFITKEYFEFIKEFEDLEFIYEQYCNPFIIKGNVLYWYNSGNSLERSINIDSLIFKGIVYDKKVIHNIEEDNSFIALCAEDVQLLYSRLTSLYNLIPVINSNKNINLYGRERN